MTIFYWTMAVLIVGTLVPSIFYWVLYADLGPRRRRAVADLVSLIAHGGPAGAPRGQSFKPSLPICHSMKAWMSACIASR
jgi:hypothetical protein